ncbi:PREDICTED: probable ATP-dependent RNA helicase ddx5 [Tarenaya hassleriana]|uniref:probable ATP-dependent RNA helicase ddx5 n=1 Tax=Tarenaya hassleriana TaxID=28532 RepID=UPI00053C7A23|nr:PREDICTED: probable ATP-dependent RNA helicase ddx5 [Tarenaya hassleriana]
MAKGDDAVMRKKNRVMRKKLNSKNDSSTVSARIASIIAAKKRRKSGKRRMCQGMCFSLPTAEDPFNDRHDKVEIIKKKTKKVKSKKTLSEKGSFHKMGDDETLKEDKKTSAVLVNSVGHKGGDKLGGEDIQISKKQGKLGGQMLISENMDGPAKFLILCLNEIESSFRIDGTYSEQNEKPLFVNPWGIEFWRCFSDGKDILETSGSSSTIEQIAWIVSTAADAMARREKQGLAVSIPFLLFLVPSHSKASKVRSVCKPLKDLGIHTVCLHPGASLDHQISGLKSCEPEFLVSTPERLLELVSLKGIDISGVSLLVIDELGSLSSGGCLDALKSIKQTISSNHRTIIFSDSHKASNVSGAQSLLAGSISRVSLNDSVASQSFGIIQSVNICASDDEKLQKCAELLDSHSSKVLYIMRKEDSLQKLRVLLKLKGYLVSGKKDSKILEVKKSGKPSACLIDLEQLDDATGIEEFESVVLPDFVPATETYVEILTKMARQSVQGLLQSFLTENEASSSAGSSLVKVLEECGHVVPEALRNLS